MTRLRILSLLAVAALLLGLAAPAAAATPATGAAGTIRVDVTATAADATSAGRPSARLAVRQLRRALPRPASFSRGTTRRFEQGDFITLCGSSGLAGPVPVNAAGARYDRGDLLSFMGVEEHRNVRAARQRFDAVNRQIRQNCDGRVIAGLRQESKRTRPVRRIGQQNWVRGYALRDTGDGRVIGEYLVHVYRIGRFVVFADIIGGSTADPTVARRPLQRPFRDLGNGVRRL